MSSPSEPSSSHPPDLSVKRNDYMKKPRLVRIPETGSTGKSTEKSYLILILRMVQGAEKYPESCQQRSETSRSLHHRSEDDGSKTVDLCRCRERNLVDRDWKRQPGCYPITKGYDMIPYTGNLSLGISLLTVEFFPSAGNPQALSLAGSPQC